MNDLHLDIQRLSNEAANLPEGPTKISLLEEAVRLADLTNDRILAYQMRWKLIGAGTFAGRHDAALVAFAWCCAEFDRHPEDYDLPGLLWRYKWIVMGAVEFPEISLSQINQLFADMERRYREYGSTLHALMEKRRDAALRMGQIELANDAHARLSDIARDNLSDCRACTTSMHVEFLLESERWSEAAELAEAMLRRGEGCAEEPHCVLAKSLLPLFHLGRLDEARKNQAKGYRLVRGGLEFVQQWARHLVFLALTAEMEKARRLLDRHLHDALVCVDQIDRFEFYVAALLFNERLLRDGVSTVKLRLPESITVRMTRKGCDVAALAAWFRQAATDLANRFDARNGNGFFQGRIDRIPALLDAALPTVKQDA